MEITFYKISCNHCKKSHRKCDCKQPCSNCAMRNLICEYSPRKKPTFKNSEKQLQAELLKLKSQYERLERSEKYWRNKCKAQLKNTKPNEQRNTTNEIYLYFYNMLINGVTIHERLPDDVSKIFSNQL